MVWWIFALIQGRKVNGNYLSLMFEIHMNECINVCTCIMYSITHSCVF